MPPTGIGGGGSGDPSGDPFPLLINDLTFSQRMPTDAEVHIIRQHVARAGFDSDARERVRGELSGEVWQGQTIKGNDMLPPDVRHFVKHVQKRKEWPADTDLARYLATIADIVLDTDSGILLGRYQGAAWQLTFVRQSGSLRGANGLD